jgi:hypothetical protein
LEYPRSGEVCPFNHDEGIGSELGTLPHCSLLFAGREDLKRIDRPLGHKPKPKQKSPALIATGPFASQAKGVQSGSFKVIRHRNSPTVIEN